VPIGESARYFHGGRLCFFDGRGIRVDNSSWYAVGNGIWFSATSVNGPWVVTSSDAEKLHGLF